MIPRYNIYQTYQRDVTGKPSGLEKFAAAQHPGGITGCRFGCLQFKSQTQETGADEKESNFISGDSHLEDGDSVSQSPFP